MIKKTLLSVLILISILTGCTNTEKEKETKKISKEEKEEIYLLIKGISLAENGNLEEALGKFKEITVKNPKNIEAVRYTGLCYSKLGDIENGKKYFEMALKLNKYDQETLYNYSVLCYSIKDYEKSKELLERIKIENIDRKVMLAKGYVYFQLNNYLKSYEEFSKIIFDGTEYNIDVYRTYISVLKKNGKNDEIYKFAYNLYTKEKTNFQNLVLLTDYLVEITAYNNAEEFLKNYGKDNGYSKNVLLKIGELMLAKQDFEQTKTYVTLLDEKYSMDTDVLKFKVKYYRAIGMEEEAKNIEKMLNNISRSEK